MGEVLAFKPGGEARKPQVVRGSDVKPCPVPAWKQALKDRFFDLGAWRLSAKGNPYIRIDEHCVTLFRRRGGWGWCIAADARHEPLWSEAIWEDEHDARIMAWKALWPLAAPKEA